MTDLHTIGIKLDKIKEEKMSKKMLRSQTLKLEGIQRLRLAAINCQRGFLGLAQSFSVAAKAIERQQKKQ